VLSIFRVEFLEALVNVSSSQESADSTNKDEPNFDSIINGGAVITSSRHLEKGNINDGSKLDGEEKEGIESSGQAVVVQISLETSQIRNMTKGGDNSHVDEVVGGILEIAVVGCVASAFMSLIKTNKEDDGENNVINDFSEE
jgi:hypothetical protein